MVAEDDAGGLAGQLAFVPVELWIDGADVCGWRVFALVLTKEQRRPMFANPVRHPFFRLYRRGVEELRDGGAEIVYGMPALRLLPVIGRMPMWETATFPLWSLPLGVAPHAARDPRHEALPAEDATPAEIDALGLELRARHPCSAARSAAVLAWKARAGDYGGVAVRRSGRLVGFATTRVKRAGKGDARQMDVCDVLVADDEALRATLAAAVAHAQRVAAGFPEEDPLRKVTLLVTPAVERHAAALGFVRDAYDFPLAIQVLGGSIASDDVRPARWYLASDD